MFFWWSRFFFPIKYLSGWQPLSLPLETCHLGGEDPMGAVPDPTEETETSSLPSDNTAVADPNEDKTTVTIQAPKRRKVCCSFDIYPEDKGSK